MKTRILNIEYFYNANNICKITLKIFNNSWRSLYFT